jgi:chemotaxis protein CheX
MLGEEQTAINHDIEDAAGELTNIIFGHTKKALEQKGLKLEKAIPSVITGANHAISHQSTGPIIVTPFESDLGPFYVQICLLSE